MLILTLQRETTSPPAAIGRLSVNSFHHSDTLERPWMDNKRGISCIPPGRYPVIITISPRFGRPMLRLAETAPRWGILIHAANQVDQLAGCIALGKRHGRSGLIESRKEVGDLFAKVKAEISRGEPVFLDILDPVSQKGAV